MSARNTKTTLAAIKLGIFTLASVLVTGLLAVIMGHFGFGGQHTYKAIFSSASELKSGDDVRIAGVSVGDVKSVDLYKGDKAMVTFKVSSDVPMTTASGAEVRYLNLVGDRYLALTQGKPGAAPLQAGAAVVLGAVLSPIAAILPFVDPGLAKDANCVGLVSNAQAKGAPVRVSATTATPSKR